MHFFFNKKGETNKNLIEQIILEKYNQYYCLAYSYVHNEADAYDIVQNGAYKALKGSHALKKPEYAEIVSRLQSSSAKGCRGKKKNYHGTVGQCKRKLLDRAAVPMRLWLQHTYR